MDGNISSEAVEFKEICSDRRADLAQNEARMHTSEISEIMVELQMLLGDCAL